MPGREQQHRAARQDHRRGDRRGPGLRHQLRHPDPRSIDAAVTKNGKRGGECRRRARLAPNTETRDNQRLPPILAKLLDMLVASVPKPTAIVATMTPAIRPYS